MVLSSVKQDGGELAFLRTCSIRAVCSKKWQFKFVCHLLSHTKGRRECASGKGQPAAPHLWRSRFLLCKVAVAPLDEHSHSDCSQVTMPVSPSGEKENFPRGSAQRHPLTSHWWKLVICPLLNQSLVRDIGLWIR